MKQRTKNAIGTILENADDFHNFLVLVIPALKAWVKGHTGKGVRELAAELHRKLGVEFEDAREAIERKHDQKEEPEG
jgi:hypothetical protein